jgi:hypothetical protein
VTVSRDRRKSLLGDCAADATLTVPAHTHVLGEYGVDANDVTYDLQAYAWVGEPGAARPWRPGMRPAEDRRRPRDRARRSGTIVAAGYGKSRLGRGGPV